MAARHSEPNGQRCRITRAQSGKRDFSRLLRKINDAVVGIFIKAVSDKLAFNLVTQPTHMRIVNTQHRKAIKR